MSDIKELVKEKLNQLSKVELVRNNKVIESAKLMKGKHNLIYWNKEFEL